MALYHEAAHFLVPTQGQSGSLKLRVFSLKDIKSVPKQIYALVLETSKWSPVLSQVIDNSRLLQDERKLSPSLALLLVHDLLISKSGIATPASHPLRLAVTRHKARLGAELAKIRIKKGAKSIHELRSHLSITEGPQVVEHVPEASIPVQKDWRWPHPRWVRINTLKTTLHDQLRTTFANYENVSPLKKVLLAKPATKVFCIDEHISNLIALPAETDLTKIAAYHSGLIIFQDKASCFPASILDPDPTHGACLDACAAPGNKTTHIAAILHSHYKDHHKTRVWACERDKFRAETLTRMVGLAGCRDMVTVKAGQDFLLLDPTRAPWKDIGSLLLDPSCSGSGIVGRDETLAVTFPAIGTDTNTSKTSQKRKRGKWSSTKPDPTDLLQKGHPAEEELLGSGDRDDQLMSRLKALSTFQLQLLLHAFRFPSAQRISYSTCSIHAEENEHVVIAALQSATANECGWRLLRRDEQATGMKSWPFRGDIDAANGIINGNLAMAKEIAESCIRCRAGTEHGTQGFFVAAFIRDSRSNSVGNGEDSVDPDYAESGEEWEGLSSDDG